jgi:hypothetical protein
VGSLVSRAGEGDRISKPDKLDETHPRLARGRFLLVTVRGRLVGAQVLARHAGELNAIELHPVLDFSSADCN